MLIGPAMDIAFDIVTLEFAVDVDLPITKPPKMAILLMVIAEMEPEPTKLVPAPLHVKALAVPALSVKALLNGAIVSVPVLVIVVVLLDAWWSPIRVTEPEPTLKA